MKEVMKFFLITLFKAIYVFYSYNTKRKIYNLRNILFSYWLRNSFERCGNRLLVYSPIFLRGEQYIRIGEDFNSLDSLRLECWDEFEGCKYSPSLVIGNKVVMNRNVHIGCVNSVIVGDNVLFGSNVLITDHQHGHVDNRDLGIPPTKRVLSTSGPVVIEDNVWIGENVSIMPNVTIGAGCIIGANSVVTKSFPRNSVLAGIPAKLIKTLNIE